jgi:Fe2+ transport system protein FeoA
MIAQTMVTADQLEQLKINDKSLIYADGDYRYPIEGKITVLNEIPEESTGLYEVEIAIENTDLTLRSGEYAEIEFIVDEREVPVIPKKAVKRVGQDNFVFVIRDKIASERMVVLGITQGENIEVISGLSLGEIIVDRGRAFVKDGDAVNVID